MKILLANPPWYTADKPHLWGIRAGSRWPHFRKRTDDGELPRYIPFPFFLAIAGALLQRRGHEVLLIDGVAEGISIEIFLEKVRQFQPELVFTETSTPSLNYDIEILRRIKTLCPDILTVMAGTHSPVMASEMMKKEELPDFWIAGEYEFSLCDLCDRIEKKRTGDRGDNSHFSSIGEIDGLIPRGKEFISYGI